MAVKAVEMVRKIRDKHYEQTRDLSPEQQIIFFRKKSRLLQKELKKFQTRQTRKSAQASGR